MKTFAVATAVLVVLAEIQTCFSGATMEELAEKMGQITEMCFVEAQVPEEEQKRILDAKFALDGTEPSTLCFAKCAMEQWGLMSDGVLDEDAVKSKFGSVIGEEKLTEFIEMCKDEKGDAPCETEFKMFTCLHKLKE